MVKRIFFPYVGRGGAEGGEGMKGLKSSVGEFQELFSLVIGISLLEIKGKCVSKEYIFQNI